MSTEGARSDATRREGRPVGVAAFFGKIERGIATVVEWLTVALTVADMLVLLAGVIARYAFNRPLMWSDEVASMLFLWLAMLGAVVALHRGEHMRMTAVVKALPEGWRGFVETIALGVTASFLCILVLARTHETPIFDNKRTKPERYAAWRVSSGVARSGLNPSVFSDVPCWLSQT